MPDAPAGPSRWQTARIVSIRAETARAKTFRLALPGPSAHRAGQHYVVRPDATAYVCGSSGFADHAGDLLVDLGLPPERIRVERFGPTG